MSHLSMMVALVLARHPFGAVTLDALWATVLLVLAVGLSLATGVAASYLLVRMVLGTFRSRSIASVGVQARAAAAGD